MQVGADPGDIGGGPEGSTDASAEQVAVYAELYVERKKLARGRGLNASEPQTRIGPALARAVSGDAAGGTVSRPR